MFTYEEALEASKNYFNGDSLAAEVFLGKYALRNEKGELLELTPTDMHKRLAKEFARIEAKYPNPLSEQEIFDLFDKFKYIIPQGSPMAGIGNPYQTVSLSNCEVIESPHDSYGGILHTDQESAQLYKRRCVASDSNVVIKNKGIIKIKDVVAGDKILSFDINSNKTVYKTILNKFKTEVAKEDRIVIKTKSGILKTSNKHPILIYGENGLQYKAANELNTLNEVCIKPEQNILDEKYLNISEEMKNIGWFIGAHLGDGTGGLRTAICENNNKTDSVYKYETLRFRILGDNENVIKKYAFLVNKMTNTNRKYSICSNRKKYKVDVWHYASNNIKNKIIAEKYLDGQIGKKVYTGKVPSIVQSENLWIPFIAGLIDTDGHVKHCGTVNIRMCMMSMMDVLSSWLSSQGISHTTYTKPARRKNEAPFTNLLIQNNSNNRKFLLSVKECMAHEKKIKTLENVAHDFSHKFFVSQDELSKIINNGKSLKCKDVYSYLYQLNKRQSVALGGLNYYRVNDIIDDKKYSEIQQRLFIESIEKDLITEEYYDIEVEDTNNFFCGNFGLINIHNCGVGFDISNIRPKGLPTNSAAKTTDGIGIFMERFSNTCREVAQNGRRGALMLTISVHHPEIETFIDIKKNLTKVTGANISIRLSDDFMNAVESDSDFELKWPIDSSEPTFLKKIKAKNIWNKIIDCAWTSAEPGVLFWDTITKWTTAEAYASKGFKNVSTNPCSELVLSANDSCRLTLLNTFGYVINPFSDNAYFDYDLFKTHSIIGQKLMDDVVDLELECIEKIINKIISDKEPEEIKNTELNLWKKIKTNCINGRRTGLGITGLGDTLAALNVKYGSNESIEISEKIYKTLAIGSYTSSVFMAKERGTFPAYEYDLEKEHPFVQRIMQEDSGLEKQWKKHGRRNIANLTTAPAGSVSILTQTTSGIEPAFLLSYTRRKKINPNDQEAKVDFTDQMGDKWQEYVVYHHGFKTWMEVTGKSDPKDSPYSGATSNDIDWKQSVKLQGAAQKWVDHSISKTCNLPNDVSKEVVSDVYMEAWKQGCKGFTVYRDGCRTGVLVSNDENKSSKDTASKKLTENHAPKRPKELSCDIHVMTVRGEKWTFFIGKMDNKPYEVIGGQSKYISIPKRIKSGKIIKYNRADNPVARYDLHYDYDKGPDEEGVVKDLVSIFENATEAAFTRTVSLSLRHGIPIQYVVEQITKGSEKDDDLFSFSKALSRVLKTYIVDGTKTNKVCEKCSSTQVSYQEGCLLCLGCGTSKCG